MHQMSLIPVDNAVAIMAVLFGIALFGFWAEQKNWGKMVTGAVWAILGAILASNIGLIPKSAPAYSFVFKYLVPMLVPLFLLHADVRKIIGESGRVGIAFILACLGTMAGAIAGVSLLDLGAYEADLAGIFTATYTGGSVNYVAVIQSTGFDQTPNGGAVIGAATAVDNLMSAVFLAVLAMLPASKWLMYKFAQRNHSEGDEAALQSETNVSGWSLSAAAFFALAVVALADLLVAWLSANSDVEWGRLRYVFITLLSVIPATLAPRTMAKLKGGQTLGLVLAFVFFATIAAGADIAKLIAVAPILFTYVVILLSVHFVVLVGLGYVITQAAKKAHGDKPGEPGLALSLPEMIIASNAAVLGATTAPALAVARGWSGLATPGVLVGVAGYIVGTPLGILIARLLA